MFTPRSLLVYFVLLVCSSDYSIYSVTVLVRAFSSSSQYQTSTACASSRATAARTWYKEEEKVTNCGRRSRKTRVIRAVEEDNNDNDAGGQRRGWGEAAFLKDWIWKGVALPFPSLRRILRHRESHLKEHNNRNNKTKIALGMSLKEGLVFLMAYLTIGALAYSFVLEKWSIVDSLYFSCVCFSTTGYGDLCPSTAASKLFTCVFGLGGIAFLGAAVATIGGSIVQAEVEAVTKAQRQGREQMSRLFEGMPKVLQMARHPLQNVHMDLLSLEKSEKSEHANLLMPREANAIQKFRNVRTSATSNEYLQSLDHPKEINSRGRLVCLAKRIWSVVVRKHQGAKSPSKKNEYLQSLDITTKRESNVPPTETKSFNFIRYLPVMSIVLGGGAIMRYLNGCVWTWTETLYFSIVTATTIGFGDIGPQTRASRIFAIIFIPLSVAAVGELLSDIAVSTVRKRQRALYESQLRQSLTIEHIRIMDGDGDGKITREEYIQFMLIEMGFVTKKELDELDAQFDRLDVTRSGYLDNEDLKLMAKLRGATVID